MEFGYKAQINVLFILLKSKVYEFLRENGSLDRENQ